tara:strand:- start:1120 stop:1401 length:282 start_codon:yes stop_codon:yes gene_type:complete
MMTNKDIEEFNHMLDNIKKDDRGPNDLEKRIEDLMRISLSHQNLNADLRKEVLFWKKKCEHFEYMYNQLKKEKEDLDKKGRSMLNEFRNKGDV